MSEHPRSPVPDVCHEDEFTPDQIERRLRGHLMRNASPRDTSPELVPFVRFLPPLDLGPVVAKYQDLATELATVSATSYGIAKTALAWAVNRERELLQDIAALRTESDRSEQAIVELQRVLTEREEAIVRLRAAMERHTRDLAHVASDRDRLQQIVELRDQAVAELRTVLHDRQQDIAELRTVLEARKRDLPQVMAELELVRVRQTQAAAASDHIQSLLRHALRTDQQGDTMVDPLAERVLAIHWQLLDGSGLRAARATLEEHFADDTDRNFANLLQTYDEATALLLPFWDIRTAVRVLASVIKPAEYLEVGTRRGWSLAQVFAEVPEVDAYVFELWATNYAEAHQGDPQLIVEAMRRVVGPERSPRITFINGNSHDTLPAFFAGQVSEFAAPPEMFDLIAVDGDHTRLGAWWDLYDLMGRVKVGGALVFDDLDYAGDEELGGYPETENPRPPLPQHLRSLGDVWGYVQTHYPNFLFLNPSSLRFRAGIALRLA